MLTSRHVSTSIDVPEGCAEGFCVETEVSSSRNGCHDFGVCDKVVLDLNLSSFHNRSLLGLRFRSFTYDPSKTRPCRRLQNRGTPHPICSLSDIITALYDGAFGASAKPVSPATQALARAKNDSSSSPKSTPKDKDLGNDDCIPHPGEQQRRRMT